MAQTEVVGSGQLLSGRLARFMECIRAACGLQRGRSRTTPIFVIGRATSGGTSGVTFCDVVTS